MPGSTAPLLCELHAHTTFSDGELAPAELVDLYGAAGFDVLAITDHVCRAADPRGGARSVCAADHRRYLAVIEAEAERARRVYGLLVIPGLELTYEDEDPRRSAHAVAVGLRSWVGVDRGLDSALEAARAAGAALIAAHPYTLQATESAPRTTARFSEEREWARGAVDRFELCNRHDFFAWVAEERMPVVATGDFHARAPGDLEDAAALSEGRGGGGGLPSLGTGGLDCSARCCRPRR
jgi:3',5'-nucleoside bisphosphate phosphatase